MPVKPARRRPRLPSFIAVAAAALATLALALWPAASAAAHDYIVDTAPKADSVATQPVHRVKLTFDDVVLDLSGDGSSSILEVTGPDGAHTHFETGCPTTLGRTVTVPVALGGAGTYLVSWQIVSADGHTVSGTYTFTYHPPAGATAAKGTDSRPSCGRKTAAAADGSGSTGGTGQAAQATSTDATGIVIGIAVGVVVLAIIAVVVILLLTRTKSGKRPGWRPEDG